MLTSAEANKLEYSSLASLVSHVSIICEQDLSKKPVMLMPYKHLQTLQLILLHYQ
jgi:hypothetical protein